MSEEVRNPVPEIETPVPVACPRWKRLARALGEIAIVTAGILIAFALDAQSGEQLRKA